MIREPPRSPLSSSSAASDVYKRQMLARAIGVRGQLLSGRGPLPAVVRQNCRFLTSSPASQDHQLCWVCGSQLSPSHSVFCPSQHLQPPSESSNHFERLACERRFDIDHDQLQSAYKDRQKQLHPDRFANRQEEQELAHQHASLLNIAYSALRTPHTRATYLLSLENIDIGDEGKSLDDVELLSEIMELRFRIEDASGTEELQALSQEVQVRLEKCIEETTHSFASNDLVKATRDTTRMQYVYKLVEELNQMI
eukprot:TRINITY_DN44656_c0_g2_i1.p1 TRINITY_DN44656_c0_g2~~TRINITY_DN44656_c0_g2_i1.p1  ORF type:complete len:253 (-),score=29.80 TRINITY_DN44656_c0_g2_i1:235-993(-)